MAIKDIIAALEEEVQVKRLEIIGRANRQAEQIINEANRQAEQAREEQQHRLFGNAQAEEARVIQQASFAKQSTLAEARESLASEVFAEAEEKLIALADSNAYEPILRNLIVESWEAASSLNGDRVILVRDADRQLATKIANEMSLKASIENSNIKGGGVIIASADRRQRLVNTLLSRLEKAKPFLAPQIAGILWQDD